MNCGSVLTWTGPEASFGHGRPRAGREIQTPHKDERKVGRRERILAAVKAYRVGQNVMACPLNGLWRCVAVNKSKLFTCYGSREEVLIILMYAEMHGLVGNFGNRVVGRDLSAAEFARIMADQYDRQHLL